MSRMLHALQVAEEREHSDRAPIEPARVLSSVSLEVAEPVRHSGRVAEPALPRRFNAFEVCTLPIAERVADSYMDLARNICQQGAANYCNVIFFVSLDHGATGLFSMAHAAQAFALQSVGHVLLVDGDLRRGQLSQSVWPSGGGLIEAMQGTANWPDVIHPTTTPCVDFVPRGIGPIPTLERAQFGWGALRPKYRVVLIGVGDLTEPETGWLATRCDAVYPLISKSKTRRPVAVAAVNALRSNGALVSGAIVIDD